MSTKKFIIDLLFPVIRLWAASWRFRGNLPSDRACIMMMWHEELFPVLKAGTGQNWICVTSTSRDGDFLVRLITRWGYRTSRGSASRHDKATSMLRNMIKLARDNKVTTAADGPRGPRRKIKIGMLRAAQKSGVPLYLVRVRARGMRFEKAWDKSLIPYPFAKVDVLISEPLLIGEQHDKDGLRKLAVELADKFNRLGD